jgi:hypothetical protein
MTRKQLQKTIFTIIGLYVFALITGLVIFYIDNSDKKIHYQIFKDLIPLIIAIPAAYLGFCFQRRSSFLQTNRLLWTHLISSVNSAIHYTQLKDPTEIQFGETLLLLSKSIDEVRGVYKNLEETKNKIGLYPFECLKEIHDLVSELGFGKLEEDNAMKTRKQITVRWKRLRRSFLSEFDRSEPTVFDSPYKNE